MDIWWLTRHLPPLRTFYAPPGGWRIVSIPYKAGIDVGGGPVHMISNAAGRQRPELLFPQQ